MFSVFFQYLQRKQNSQASHPPLVFFVQLFEIQTSFSAIIKFYLLHYMNRGYSYTGYGHAFSMPKAYMAPQKYPQDIQCVYESQDPTKGSIYVSNVQAAQNQQTLARLKIKAVLTCARGYDRNIPKSKLDMFQYFPFDDKETCIIAPYFEKACDFITKALEKTNVLVHCIAGVSRSVSMVLAYFIREKGMSYEKAYNEVKSRRKIISPNEGFIRQLKQYAKQIRDKMNMTQSQTLEVKRSQQRQKTPQLKNESTPIPNNSNYYYKTTVKRTDSYKYKSDLQNEEDYTELKRGKTDMFKNFEMTNFSTTLPSRNTQNSKRNQYERNTIDKLDQNNQQMIKSSTFVPINWNKTPQKIREVTPTKNAQLRERIKNYQQGSNNEKYSNRYESRNTYFQEMNKQLNDKIEAIHTKYEKEREKLIGKRYSSARKTFDLQQESNNTGDYAQRNTLTDKKYDPYIRYEGKYNRLNEGYGKYELYDRTRNIPTKYTDLYENKYARGLNYPDLRGGAYRGRYY